MSTIDKYIAPLGYYAVEPEKFYPDGISECTGCCFDSEDNVGCMLDMRHDYIPIPCWAEGREDERDVIFKPVLH